MAIFSRKAPLRPSSPIEPSPSAASADEARVRAIGAEMLGLARAGKTGVLSRQFWSDKLMDWAMKDREFKVQLFRFVDAYPTLTTPEQVYDHLRDYLSQPGVTPPPGLALGLKAGGAAKSLLVGQISRQITSMASRFIAGTDAASAVPMLRTLWSHGVGFSVDLLGEACISDAEADIYRDTYLDLVRALPVAVADWPANERLERDHLGAVPRVNVSIKISSLSGRLDPLDHEGSMVDLMSRLRPILKAARDGGVAINFDMEQFEFKDFTLDLFERCCDEMDFHAGLALQAYLRSGDADARRIADWSRRTGRAVTVRLVKGAYWDYETIHAEEMGWPCPVWPIKRETDACYERMTDILLDACPHAPGAGGVRLALGSHNVRSIAYALAGLERRGLPTEAIELQMIHGMADQLKDAGVRMGLRVREYVPVGEMIPGMAYLVRRLLENTSNESWLKAGFLDNASDDDLLRNPHTPPIVGGTGVSPVNKEISGTGVSPVNKEISGTGVSPVNKEISGTGVSPVVDPAARHALSDAVAGVDDGKPFLNEPVRDFADAAQRERFAAAVAGATVPRIANDATVEDVAEAVRAAHEFFPVWRATDPHERAAVLIRTAEIMRQQRDGIAGVMIREAGKTWREADADVCEAIDFCAYYARQAVPLFERRRLGRFIGELDEVWHQPRGVAGVISPWNFPLAICCGMTSAALVTGNTVVVKPAEQTPGIARVMVDILYEAGCPREALHLLPGPGETVGAALVRDPRTAIIAFTGSKAVGLDIIQAAGVTPEEQAHVKKVVCEMGGKNAIVIDASADLDEAVLGVRHSAFGFQGQKCSACSRVYVVRSAYDTFLHRLVESTRTLVVGDPADPATDVGPVIDDEAKAKITRYIELGAQQARLAIALDVPAGLEKAVGKPYVGPVVFADVPQDAAIMRDEIFGPVLAVAPVDTFEEGLRLANDSRYKLTGGVYSRKPSNLARAKREFRVGNLYLNRGITGALVGRQPFGGFGLSGVGSKAGGAEYLYQFVEPRASCENTMRRGFAPEL